MEKRAQCGQLQAAPCEQVMAARVSKLQHQTLPSSSRKISTNSECLLRISTAVLASDLRAEWVRLEWKTSQIGVSASSLGFKVGVAVEFGRWRAPWLAGHSGESTKSTLILINVDGTWPLDPRVLFQGWIRLYWSINLGYLYLDLYASWAAIHDIFSAESRFFPMTTVFFRIVWWISVWFWK